MKTGQAFRLLQFEEMKKFMLLAVALVCGVAGGEPRAQIITINTGFAGIIQ